MKVIFSGILLILLVAVQAGIVFAHGGEPHAGENLWTTWNLSPPLMLGLLISSATYLKGVRALWENSRIGAVIRRWQAVSFLTGFLVLALALISPVDALGEAALSWHMVQHLLLVLVAGPLIVLGNPLLAYLWAAPAPLRIKAGRWWNRQSFLKSLFRFWFHPLTVWVLYAAAMWVWHIPVFYQAALQNEFIHILEHLSFLAAALLFWWTVLPRQTPSHSVGYGPAVLLLFTTALQGGLLGALMTFSEEVWYPLYQESDLLVTLTPLEDQIIAGLLMWVPPGLVYLGFALTLLARLINVNEGEERRPVLDAPLFDSPSPNR